MSRTPDLGHIVIVALFFPPSRASGVYRPLGMANYFVAQGWRVTVVTGDFEFSDDVTGSSDPELVAAIDPRVRVERVFVPREGMIRDIRKMSERHARYPRAYAAMNRLRQKLFFPDKYSQWIKPVVRAVTRVHGREHVDVVLATGNPWSSFRSAHILKRRHRIPYVLDYRDSWTLDQYAAKPLKGVKSREYTWEKRMLADAHLSLFVNEPMRAWHADRYPEAAARMEVVENGIDPDTLGVPTFTKPSSQAPIRFGYVGTITRHLPHSVMWAAWAIAKQHPALKGATMDLYGHLGFFTADISDVKRMLPLHDGLDVVWRGPVSKTAVGDVYGGLDVVVGMVPSSRFVTAGKTYESMASGRVIVGVFGPDTAAADPLKGYPSQCMTTALDSESVAQALVDAAVLARKRTKADFHACIEYSQRYHRSELLAPLDRKLRTLIDA